jgi:hypothetical protein
MASLKDIWALTKEIISLSGHLPDSITLGSPVEGEGEEPKDEPGWDKLLMNDEDDFLDVEMDHSDWEML